MKVIKSLNMCTSKIKSNKEGLVTPSLDLKRQARFIVVGLGTTFIYTSGILELII